MAHKKPNRSFAEAVPLANGKKQTRTSDKSESAEPATPKSQTPDLRRKSRKESAGKKAASSTAERGVPPEKNATPNAPLSEKGNGRRRSPVESKVPGNRAQLPVERTNAKPFVGRGGSNSTKQGRDLSLLTPEPMSGRSSEKQTAQPVSSFRGRRATAEGGSTAPPVGDSRQKTRGRTPQKSQSKNGPKRPTSPLVYGARLLILGVGVGVMAGTLLSVFDPASRYPAQSVEQVSAGQSQLEQKGVKKGELLAEASELPAVQMKQEMTALKTELQNLASQQADLLTGALFVDVDSGDYVDLNGEQAFAAASTIKVPILVAFFQEVDAGKLQLDEKLTMRQDLVAKEAGEMQYKPVGSKFTALETATQMIMVSDNTATNMLIDRLGGAAALNERFQSWGLSSTIIRNVLPDLEGTNTTSPADMVKLMGLVTQGKLMSLRSRDRLLEIMRRTVNNSLLPQGLGEGAIIAHKTGDIGTFVGDVGMVDMPSGKRYLAAVIVKGPHNDPRSTELIRQFSRKVYQSFAK